MASWAIKGGQKNVPKTKPRNSNADDTRLIAPTLLPRQETDNAAEEEIDKAENAVGWPWPGSGSGSGSNTAANSMEMIHCDVETTDVHPSSYWRINKSSVVMANDNGSLQGVRSVCLRDMGTEMTPTASQEPSRTATPIRAAATPVGPRSPITSRSSTPTRCQHGSHGAENHQDPKTSTTGRNALTVTSGGIGMAGGITGYGGSQQGISSQVAEHRNSDHAMKMNPLESRAMAWDEAERAKYMARYKREEVKIQAWENHEKRKADTKMKKMEVKAERMKARAQEKYANKIASTKSIAEQRRANAEAKLNDKALKTSEKADYIRRTGQLPSSFSFKLPSGSLCWCW
ncbi:hypothetical protein Dimus_015227 [Dionaea muscipula]